MPRLIKRALLVGLGACVVAVALAALWATQYPGSYIHVTPLQGFGTNVVGAVFILLVVTAGAAIGLLAVRSRQLALHPLWFFVCGLLVGIIARLLPTFPAFLESCPTGEVCNPYDWGQALDWLREPLLAFAATAILGLFSSHRRLPQPNNSLERTREG
jgi:MFS family permease